MVFPFEVSALLPAQTKSAFETNSVGIWILLIALELCLWFLFLCLPLVMEICLSNLFIHKLFPLCCMLGSGCLPYYPSRMFSVSIYSRSATWSYSPTPFYHCLSPCFLCIPFFIWSCFSCFSILSTNYKFVRLLLTIDLPPAPVSSPVPSPQPVYFTSLLQSGYRNPLTCFNLPCFLSLQRPSDLFQSPSLPESQN